MKVKRGFSLHPPPSINSLRFIIIFVTHLYHFCDVSKAFNRVWHHVLIERFLKLIKFNRRGCLLRARRFENTLQVEVNVKFKKDKNNCLNEKSRLNQVKVICDIPN